VDVTYVPSQLTTAIYTNSNFVTQSAANGTGSLSTSASLFLLNNSTSSNVGSVANLYNFKVYNPNLSNPFIRKNYNAQAARFGLPLATYIPPAPLLLDQYAGAAAAYSLRKLRTLYPGAAIRVRRSSDNTEADIGFNVNDELDTIALLAFCGAGNGFVTKWYDQSGNANNATQTTAANQPQIVSSGTVITDNGKPSVQYDGINDGLNSTILPYATASAISLFYIYSSNLAAAANSNTAVIYNNGIFGVTPLRTRASSTGILNPETMFLDCRKSIGGGERLGSSTYARALNTMVLENEFWLSSGTSFYQNNNAISLNLSEGVTTSENLTPNLYNTSGVFNLGYIDFGVYANQKISEFVIYLSNESSNRTGIETNINNFYSIY
jgi:hypothetical protein